jgi:glycine dehydrogenase subunit 1
MALKATAYLTALGPQGLRETAELCTRKAHYAAEQLSNVGGIHMRFDRPFFKEFTIQIRDLIPPLIERLLEAGYHAGLQLSRWYPKFADCATVAVTEKRTKAEIDGLVDAFSAQRAILISDSLHKRTESGRVAAKLG